MVGQRCVARGGRWGCFCCARFRWLVGRQRCHGGGWSGRRGLAGTGGVGRGADAGVSHYRPLAEAGEHSCQPDGTTSATARGVIIAPKVLTEASQVADAFYWNTRALVCCDGPMSGFFLASTEHQQPRLRQLASLSTHGTMGVVSRDPFAVANPTPPRAAQRAISSFLLKVEAQPVWWN